MILLRTLTLHMYTSVIHTAAMLTLSPTTVAKDTFSPLAPPSSSQLPATVPFPRWCWSPHMITAVTVERIVQSHLHASILVFNQSGSRLQWLWVCFISSVYSACSLSENSSRGELRKYCFRHSSPSVPPTSPLACWVFLVLYHRCDTLLTCVHGNVCVSS